MLGQKHIPELHHYLFIPSGVQFQNLAQPIYSDYSGPEHI